MTGKSSIGGEADGDRPGRRPLRFHRALLCALFCAQAWASSTAAPASAQILFEDTTTAAGITYVGDSFGASWGDFNGDGLPDLWVPRHLSVPALLINAPGGTFSNEVAATVIGDVLADTHGAGWADFDNDGDQDLLQLIGAGAGVNSNPNQFYVNDGGLLTDQALAWGLEYPFGRGRTPLWLDWDRDGELDAIVANLIRSDGQAPTALFSRRGDAFVDETLATGFLVDDNAFFVQATGLNPQDPPLILVPNLFYPQQAYRFDLQPFFDARAILGLDATTAPTQDVAIADFNGDLVQDLFLARQFLASNLAVESATDIRAFLSVNANEKGIEWDTTGDVTIQVSPDFFVPLDEIFLGAGGNHPTSHTFTLSAADAANFGLTAHTPGVDSGLFIGRDPVLPEWQLFFSKPESLGLSFSIGSTTQITNETAIGFTPSDGGMNDVLLVRSGTEFVDVSVASGLTEKTPCISVAAGDFDNDGDVDVYQVCASRTFNLPNVLLENQGGGVFAKVVGAGGAEGSDLGRGDTVAVADYDLDGFLDLFVVNGQDLGHFAAGPDQFLHNITNNGNHWLEIDLEGVISNRDGLGARVFAVAGGVPQVREQSGGAHRFSQNHNRLHFGLGASTLVNAIFVQWPSGRQQRIDNMPADQVIRVVEETRVSLDGQPSYTAGVDRGVFLWRDPASGDFHVRASGDGDPSSFTIRLLASEQIQILGGVGLGADDTVTGAPNGFELIANVDSDESGLSFSINPGTTALIAVERDGLRNPRDLHLGSLGLPREPAGWVVPLDTLPALPPFQAGVDLGLFIGLDAVGDTVEARWSGDGMEHLGRIALFSNRPLQGATGVGLEGDGTISNTFFTIVAEETVTADSDGLDVTVQPDTLLGVTYQQDNLFQSHRVNPGTFELGEPNAYLLVAP